MKKSKLTNFIIENCRKAKFVITKRNLKDGFGNDNYTLGQELDCYVLADDGNQAIIYTPPRDKYECGSFELVFSRDKKYETISKKNCNLQLYVNA